MLANSDVPCPCVLGEPRRVCDDRGGKGLRGGRHVSRVGLATLDSRHTTVPFSPASATVLKSCNNAKLLDSK